MPLSYVVQIDRMYHIENPRPFISPLTLYVVLQDFLQDIYKIRLKST